MRKTKLSIRALSMLLIMVVMVVALPFIPARGATEVTLMDEDFDGSFVLSDFLTDFPIQGETGGMSATLEATGGKDGTAGLKCTNLETYSNSMFMGFNFDSLPDTAWRSETITFTFDMKAKRYWSADDSNPGDGASTFTPYLAAQGWSFDIGGNSVKITETPITYGDAWQTIEITFNIKELFPTRYDTADPFILFRMETGGGRVEQWYDNMKMTYGGSASGDPEDPSKVDVTIREQDFNARVSVPDYFNTTWTRRHLMSIAEEGKDGTKGVKYTTTDDRTEFAVLKLGFTGDTDWRSEDVTVSFDMKVKRTGTDTNGAGLVPKLSNGWDFDGAINISASPIAMTSDTWQKIELTFNIKDLYPADYLSAECFHIVFAMDDVMTGWSHTTQWYDNLQVTYKVAPGGTVPSDPDNNADPSTWSGGFLGPAPAEAGKVAVTVREQDFNARASVPDYFNTTWGRRQLMSIAEEGKSGTKGVKYTTTDDWSEFAVLKLGFTGDDWRSEYITVSFDMKAQRVGDDINGAGLVPKLSNGWDFDGAINILEDPITITSGMWQTIEFTFKLEDLYPAEYLSADCFHIVFAMDDVMTGWSNTTQWYDNLLVTYQTVPGGTIPTDPDNSADPSTWSGGFLGPAPAEAGKVAVTVREQDFDERASVPNYFNTTWGRRDKMSIEEEGKSDTKCVKYTTTDDWSEFAVLKLGFTGDDWRSEYITVSFDMKAQRVGDDINGAGLMPKLANEWGFDGAINILETPITITSGMWQTIEFTFKLEDLYPAEYLSADCFHIVFAMDDAMTGWSHTTQWYDNLLVTYQTVPGGTIPTDPDNSADTVFTEGGGFFGPAPAEEGKDDLFLREEKFNGTRVPNYFINTWRMAQGLSISVGGGEDGSNCLKYATTDYWNKLMVMPLSFSGSDWRSEYITVSFDMKAQRVDDDGGIGFFPKLACNEVLTAAEWDPTVDPADYPIKILTDPIAMNSGEWYNMVLTFKIKDMWPETYQSGNFYLVFYLDDTMTGWAHTEQWYDNLLITYQGVPNDNPPEESGEFITLEDVNDTNVKVTAKDGMLPYDAELDVSIISEGEMFEKAQKALESIAKQFTLFDINIVDSYNFRVKFDGQIKVTVPIPDGYNRDRLAVFYMDENGKLARYEISVKDGEVSFNTEILGYYALVEVEESAWNDLESGGKIPVTGADASLPVLATFAVMVMSGAAMIKAFGVKRKKRCK